MSIFDFDVDADLFMELLLRPAPPPPPIVPLRLLGLTELPATRDDLSAAFARQVKANHPDVNPNGRLTMDELVWARKALLQKIPEPAPVTGSNLSTRNGATRNAEPRTCKGEGCEKTRGLTYRGRWRGYCWPCRVDAENGR